MMIYGNPITGDMYDVADPPKDAEGKPMTKEEWQQADEQAAMQLEKANWQAFYKALNDDNDEHALQSFHNNGYNTSTDIHMANVEWYAHAAELGFTHDQITKMVPGADFYKDEGEKAYTKGFEDEFGISIGVDDGFTEGVQSIPTESQGLEKA